MAKNFYTILGVRADATLEEIRLAFRALAWRVHPDRTVTTQNEETLEFSDVALAHRTLRAPELRAAYDAKMEMNHGKCEFCVKGSVSRQKGILHVVKHTCLRCNGTGLANGRILALLKKKEQD